MRCVKLKTPNRPELVLVQYFILCTTCFRFLVLTVLLCSIVALDIGECDGTCGHQQSRMNSCICCCCDCRSLRRSEDRRM